MSEQRVKQLMYLCDAEHSWWVSFAKLCKIWKNLPFYRMPIARLCNTIRVAAALLGSIELVV